MTTTTTDKTSYLPAPPQLCLVKMTEMEVAHEIEEHIDYVDKNGRSVQLPMKFVRSHMEDKDDGLPIIVAIAQLPIVLGDGTILAMDRGLDRDRGIIFVIPKELMRLLPRRADCTADAVGNAFDFLVNEWLCDVATDFTGRCIIIAAALTLIERSMLPSRPVFFITAGRRGGGKTTTLHMLVVAVTGQPAGANAWSTNEEERRKAVFAYFMAGVSYLIWDNIPRGTQINCPHIERSCTTELYLDRKLGVSEMVATAASTIHMFTGNNIGPKGDLASRGLNIRLEVDRADPENREFRHPDPVGWTEAHRGQILAALYTVLLGNPQLKADINAPAKTRFKVWWRLVGSAIEHAAKQYAELLAAEPVGYVWRSQTYDFPVEPTGYEAQHSDGRTYAKVRTPDGNESIVPKDEIELASGRKTPLCPPTTIDFQDLFLVQEEDDEESASLADVLASMATKWPGSALVTAGKITEVMNVDQQDQTVWSSDKQLALTLREFLFHDTPPGHAVSAKAVGNRLKRHVGEPVKHGDRTLILRAKTDTHSKQLAYYVEVKK